MAKENDINEVIKKTNELYYSILRSKKLDDEKIKKITDYMNGYFDFSDNHNLGAGAKDTDKKFEIYSSFFSIIWDENYPAVQLIHELMSNHDNDAQKKFEQTVEENNKKLQLTNNNQAGFGSIVLIVGATIIAGIGLGALLWFIR